MSIFILDHIGSWTLQLSKLVLFVPIVLDIPLLVLFLLSKISALEAGWSIAPELRTDFGLKESTFIWQLTRSLILLIIGCLNVNIVLHAFLKQSFVIQSLEHLHQWPNLFFISRLLDSVRSQNRLLKIFVVAFLCIFEKILYFNLRIICLLSCLFVF